MYEKKTAAWYDGAVEGADGCIKLRITIKPNASVGGFVYISDKESAAVKEANEIIRPLLIKAFLEYVEKEGFVNCSVLPYMPLDAPSDARVAVCKDAKKTEQKEGS